MEGGRELNKYVFITPTIMDIGGAQKYVYSKTCFLKKQGFSVFIITSFIKNMDVQKKSIQAY